MPPAILSPYHARLRRIVILLGAVAVISLVCFTERSTRSAEFNTLGPIGPQVTTPGITQITLTTKDLAYDPLRNKIYASVPSNAATNANTVVSINPSTKQIEGPLTSGSNPGSIGLSGDSHYLYVSLDNAFSIRRLDLQSQTQAPEFPLGTGAFASSTYAREIEVLPGQPESVAVVLEVAFNHQGVAIFDNGTPRPNKTAITPPNDVIEFGGNAATLFGMNTITTEFGLRKFAVDANGISVVSSIGHVLAGNEADMKFDNGLLYGNNGQVFDPQTMSLVKAFELPGGGYALATDSANNRVYFITGPFSDLAPGLWAYDLTTALPVGNVSIPGCLAGRKN